MIYDFILFEHTEAFNHLKDVELIAKMMLFGGLKVAIAEVYQEKEYCLDVSIPHITFEKNFNDKLFSEVEDVPNKLVRMFKNHITRYKYKKYLEYVSQQLNGMTKNIYAGSYSNNYSLSWIKKVKPSINVYLWGLRSHRLYEYKISPMRSSIGINSRFNRRYIYNYPNVCFFVSDEMIMREFINNGISGERLVIRRERTTDKIRLNQTNTSRSHLKLLTIGTIRPSKQVELIINALRKLTDIRVEYIIAGKASSVRYELIIEEAIKGMDNVVRKNYILSELEYQSLINDCDFLILCEKEQTSSFTSGTMNEALLNGRPIIAPDYNPYKQVIARYGVGYVFDPTNESSLITAICHAAHHKPSAFKEQLISYQNSLLFENVSKEFCSHFKNKA